MCQRCPGTVFVSDVLVPHQSASVSLNLSEGNRRNGKDRIHLWRVAAGSADEVAASLRVAEAFGYLQGSAIAKSLAISDRLLAIIWSLTH
jgi:four helix bundle protein